MNQAADPFAPEALRGIAPRDPNEPNFLAKADPHALPVLALDLATSCGWAIRTAAGVTYGTLNLAQRAREDRGGRLNRFWQWLHARHAETPFALVAYELVQGHVGDGFATGRAYAQFETLVMLFAARKSIPLKSIHTATLKKAITGRGSYKKTATETASAVGKTAMIAAVKALGYEPANSDEADALGVLIWATR